MTSCLLFAALVAWLSLVTSVPEANARPNIVFIMSDDQGWGDVGFNGGDIKTPNLDRLAAEGARLEQFYAQSLCSPSRAALLTGRYPIRYGLHIGVVRPHARYGLPVEERTLAQALREAGYRTAMSGKWHLGTAQPEFLPRQRGFDHHYGLYTGNFDYFTHRRDGALDWHRNGEPIEEEGYATQLIADEAARLIGEHASDQPLFLYVAFNAPHFPLQVPERYTQPYAERGEMRRTYAGMVTAMDEGVGQIIGALEQKRIRENTLIVFCSDNGGARPGTMADNGPFRGEKGTLYEGGVRVPAFVNWPGKIRSGTVVTEPFHLVDWYPTLLKLAGGSLEQTLPLDGVDVWPMISAGAPAPRSEILLNVSIVGGGVRVGDWKLLVNPQVKDGLEGGQETDARRDEKRRALAAPLVELFDLRNDPGEKRNLAEFIPEKVRELRSRLDTYAADAVPSKQAPADPHFRTPAIWGRH